MYSGSAPTSTRSTNKPRIQVQSTYLKYRSASYGLLLSTINVVLYVLLRLWKEELAAGCRCCCPCSFRCGVRARVSSYAFLDSLVSVAVCDEVLCMVWFAWMVRERRTDVKPFFRATPQPNQSTIQSFIECGLQNQSTITILIAHSCIFSVTCYPHEHLLIVHPTITRKQLLHRETELVFSDT